jgi:hypothetical protein
MPIQHAIWTVGSQSAPLAFSKLAANRELNHPVPKGRLPT